MKSIIRYIKLFIFFTLGLAAFKVTAGLVYSLDEKPPSLSGVVSGLGQQNLTLEQFGGGAGVDNTTAFFLASDQLASRSGGNILLKPGTRYPVNGAVILGRNVRILGGQDVADPGNPFGANSQFFNTMQHVQAIVLGTDGTISFSSGGGMEGVYVFRSNLILDGTDLPQNFTGTCLTAGTDSESVDAIYLKNNAIIGCDTAFKAQNASRLRIENNLVDANNGFLINTSGDIDRFIGNHLYGVTQANATGHETFSLRSGTAFGFYGAFLGGPYVINNFAYGYNVGVDIQARGQVSVVDSWFDGPLSPVTHRPLDATSIGIRTAELDYIEPQFRGLKISCTGTAFSFATSTKGIFPISDVVIWNTNVAFNTSAQNIVVNNFSIRGYDAGFIFNNALAANSAKLIGGILFDRNAPTIGPGGTVSPIDINAGGGRPQIIGVSRTDANLDIQNDEGFGVFANAGVISIPLNVDELSVWEAPTITKISPTFDGKIISIEAKNAGTSLSGANFLLASPWRSAHPGAVITLRYVKLVSKWVEISRTSG